MYVKINNITPETRKVDSVVKTIINDGIAIIPTDTVYAFACSIKSHIAIDRLSLIKGIKIEKAHFSFLMKNLSEISKYTRPFGRPVYKLLNKAFPGPYTFILKANNEIPSIFRSRKKTIGIRIPDNRITQSLLSLLPFPLLCTSIHESSMDGYITDPEDVYNLYQSRIDVMIDGGISNSEPSTVIDCSNDEIDVVRVGAGPLEHLL